MKISEIDRLSTTKEKTGVFTGSYAIHPITGEKVQIWIGDYVLANYGTGSVMAVPRMMKEIINSLTNIISK